VVVHGRVQGVFYRDSARQVASRLGVSGWIRNCPDGTVESVFEGSHEAVSQLVEWCRSGPRGASVERVEVFEEESEGLAGFEVR
jgi:acylphosphatase